METFHERRGILDLKIRKPRIDLPSIKFFEVYLYLVAFFIIFSSGGILDQRYNNFSQVLLIVLCLPLVFLINFKKQHILFLSFIIPLYLLINSINYQDTILSYALFLFKFFLIFLWVRFCIEKNINFLEIFNRIIIGICIYSFFTYFLFDVFRLAPYYTEVVNSKPYKVFFGFHYHWQEVEWFFGRVARNNSIFWEPGVFQIYIDFAIFYNLFLLKRIKKSALLILSLSILSTFSTTGIILAVALFIIRFLMSKPKILFVKFLKFLTSFLLLILGIYLSVVLFNQKVNNGSESFALRYNDLFVGLQLFYDKPVFGWGFLNNTEYERILGTSNNSNGLVSNLFQLGIFGLLFHFIPIYFAAKKYFNNFRLWSILAFLLYYFVQSATAPLVYSNFFIVFVCLGIFALIDKITWDTKSAHRLPGGLTIGNN